MRAANGRDEATDQDQKVGAPRYTCLGEDVVAVRSRSCLGDAERARRLCEARTDNQLLQETGLGGGKLKDA